jgi:hypothetical protein
LQIDQLSAEERKAYFHHIENMTFEKSEVSSAKKEGKIEEKVDIALKMIKKQVDCRNNRIYKL